MAHIEVWPLGICTGIKGQYVRAFRCIVERALIGAEFGPIRATGFRRRCKGCEQGSARIEFENMMGAVRLTDIEIPGRIENYRFGVCIDRSCKG